MEYSGIRKEINKILKDINNSGNLFIINEEIEKSNI